MTFKSKGAKQETITIFNKYLELHRTSEQLDVQLIPVSVLWGRSGHEKKSGLPKLRFLNGIQKTVAAIWFGRDTFCSLFTSGIFSLHGERTWL